MKKTALGFALALAMQLLILLAVPAQKMYTRATGRDVVLKVMPVDPYSLLSGYYVTLGYEINNFTAFPNHEQFNERGATVYAIVERGDDGVWQPVVLAKDLPASLPSNQIALRGRTDYGRIEYGIEEFYLPETKRTAIADDLRQHPAAARVDVKVDGRGNAALVRLRIEERVYDD
ncbi:MAG: GDYXXLXY domain-containing protein [Acidobacteria bacterium]|nr:GDYXXLXY domain-containing protein [Acidobacteriota bacterium]MBI3424885.1 GDYXXLXY domain-containing protein [Acidobacteriota bacterium]